jgi:glucose-1-phosphate thymidylyltransferase
VQFLIVTLWGVVVGVLEGIRIGLTGGNINDLDIAETVASMNMTMIVFFSSAVTFLTFWLIFRKEWKRTRFWGLSGLSAGSVVICLAVGPPMNLFTGTAVYLTNLVEIFPGYEDLINELIGQNLFIEVIVAALLVPVVEEVVFRGAVFRRLLKTPMNIPAALSIQALLFAAMHMNVVQGIYTFFVGIVLGLIYLHTKTIWAPIATHITYNLYAVIVSNLPIAEPDAAELEGLDAAMIAVMVVTFIITAGLLTWLFNIKPESNKKEKSGRRMKAIILAAGYATRMYPLTLNQPKALLPLRGKPVIDYIVDQLNGLPCLDHIYVVTNHKFYPHFSHWQGKVHSRAPISVLNDGTTDVDNRRGAIGDIRFVISEAGIDDDIVVIAGDNYSTYDLREQYAFFRAKDRDTITAGIVNDIDMLRGFAVAELDDGGKVLSLVEKPQNPATNIGVYATYFYKKDTLPLIKQYLEEGNNPDAPGHFPQWLYTRKEVYAYMMNGECYDIGTIEMYEEMNKRDK